jgi:ubiquinone/menaquinone biosynthesis C-methylase UbiE
MQQCLAEMARIVKPGGYCVLVLGDVEKEGKSRRTAEILGELAIKSSHGQFRVETIYDDKIPDERRSRRETKTTKYERILVMRKNKRQ